MDHIQEFNLLRITAIMDKIVYFPPILITVALILNIIITVHMLKALVRNQQDFFLKIQQILIIS